MLVGTNSVSRITMPQHVQLLKATEGLQEGDIATKWLFYQTLHLGCSYAEN